MPEFYAKSHINSSRFILFLKPNLSTFALQNCIAISFICKDEYLINLRTYTKFISMHAIFENIFVNFDVLFFNSVKTRELCIQNTNK